MLVVHKSNAVNSDGILVEPNFMRDVGKFFAVTVRESIYFGAGKWDYWTSLPFVFGISEIDVVRGSNLKFCWVLK